MNIPQSNEVDTPAAYARSIVLNIEKQKKGVLQPVQQQVGGVGVDQDVDTHYFKTLQQAIKQRYASTSLSTFNDDDTLLDAYTIDVVNAVRNNHLDILRSLHTTKQQNFNARNRNGETLLHLACRCSTLEIVTFLIRDMKVNMNVVDSVGRCILHDICWRYQLNTNIMKLIFTHMQSSKEYYDLLILPDNRGHTCFDYCRKEHYPIWIEFLQQHEKEQEEIRKQEQEQKQKDVKEKEEEEVVTSSDDCMNQIIRKEDYGVPHTTTTATTAATVATTGNQKRKKNEASSTTTTSSSSSASSSSTSSSWASAFQCPTVSTERKYGFQPNRVATTGATTLVSSIQLQTTRMNNNNNNTAAATSRSDTTSCDNYEDHEVNQPLRKKSNSQSDLVTYGLGKVVENNVTVLGPKEEKQEEEEERTITVQDIESSFTSTKKIVSSDDDEKNVSSPMMKQVIG